MKRSSTIGIIYLIIALVGGFSMGYFPITYIDLNNTEQTFTTLKENLLVFQLAIAGDGIVIILEIFISILLYNFFKNTSIKGSLIALLSRLGMTLIMLLNIVNYIDPIQSVLHSTEITEAFILGINTHSQTVFVWEFIFGIHMIALATLICKHLNFSKALSFGVLMGGLGYILDSINHLNRIEHNFLTSTAAILLGVAALSEITFAILLIIKRK